MNLLIPCMMGFLTFLAWSSFRLVIGEFAGFTRLTIILCLVFTWFDLMRRLALWQDSLPPLP